MAAKRKAFQAQVEHVQSPRRQSPLESPAKRKEGSSAREQGLRGSGSRRETVFDAKETGLPWWAVWASE